MKPTVLVIDDEKPILRVFAHALAGSGYGVELAESGSEGIQKFDAGNIDLVITDVLLLDVDGHAIARHVRESDQSLTPVIGMTGSPQLVGENEFNCVLAKPISITTLCDTVGKLCETSLDSFQSARTWQAKRPRKPYGIPETKAQPPQKGKRLIERRGHHRSQCQIPAKWATGQETGSGVVQDIGLGGAFIETLEPSAPGQQMALGLYPGGFQDPLLVSALIVRTDSMGMGVEFRPVTLSKKKSIQTLVMGLS